MTRDVPLSKDVFRNLELDQNEKRPMKLHSDQQLKSPVKIQHSSLPIPIPQVADKCDECVPRLSKEYDCATWNMYHRIMYHRIMAAREKCICTNGPTKEQPTIAVDRLLKSKVQKKESKSDDDEWNPREMCLLNAQAHRECSCGETCEYDCLQFQLDD